MAAARALHCCFLRIIGYLSPGSCKAIAWSSLVEGGEAPYLPNCQTTLVIALCVTPLSLTEKFRHQKIWQFRDQNLVQWPILNNSHAYPFCKTTPGTKLFSIGHCTWLQIYSTRFHASFANFCLCNSLKMVAKLFSQWKWRCILPLMHCFYCFVFS